MSVKSVLSSTAVLVLGAVALTGCGSGSTATPDGSAPPRRPPASSASATPSTVKPAPARPTSPPATEKSGGATSDGAEPTGKSTPSSRPTKHPTNPPSSNATSDSYTWHHPCPSRQLSVHVVRRASAPTERVIEVRNLGSESCGLSYYPLTRLTAHAGGGQTVEPLVPSGLGGAPAYPVYAGRTVYAVIDLDPSGATTGTTPGIDELTVLADGDHMPAADTLTFPLGADARVHGPKVGLYRSTITDAIVSMRGADILP